MTCAHEPKDYPPQKVNVVLVRLEYLDNGIEKEEFCNNIKRPVQHAKCSVGKEVLENW